MNSWEKQQRNFRVEASRVERFELMAQEKANFEISRMARLLKVSRSGYYAWEARRHRGLSIQAARRERLDTKVRYYHEASNGVYGAPRIAADLHAEGHVVNVKTVARSMRRQGLEGISPRMFTPVTTIPGTPTHRIPDLVKRTWDSGQINTVWRSDITYIRTGEGWLYLCVVRDGCSRRVLGWSMAANQDTHLVERAGRMAKTLRGAVPDRVVFHADRGTQYTSLQMHVACKEMNIRQSMGRTGVCFDNAMAESFWATLKTEFTNRRRFVTRQEAKQAIGEWIEAIYNRSTRHWALSYQRPVEFEQQQAQKTKKSTIEKLAA